MQFEISTEATRRIEAIIGKADQAMINRIFDRVAMDEELLLSLLDDPVSAEDAEAIREGIADYEAGNVQSVDEVDAELRHRFGFSPRSQ